MSEPLYLLNGERATRIYNLLSAAGKGRVPLLSSHPLCDTDHENLFRFLRTQTGNRLLALAERDGECDSAERSDYESLFALCSILPELAGSGEYSRVRLALSLLLSEEKEPRAEDAERLWRAAIPVLRTLDRETLRAPFTEHRLSDADDFVALSNDLLIAYESFDVYAAAYRDAVKHSRVVSLHLSSVPYFRSPDPYHAREGYRVLRAAALSLPDGNDLAEAHAFVSSQLLRLTGECCKGADIPLLLCGPFDSAVLSDVLHYLKKQDRLPRILFSVSDEQEIKVLSDCGALSDACVVVPAVNAGSSSGTDVRRTLEAIAHAYPSGRLCYFTDGATAQGTETALNCRIAFERFLRVLSCTLDDWIKNGDLENEAAAVALGEKILFINAEAIIR